VGEESVLSPQPVAEAIEHEAAHGGSGEAFPAVLPFTNMSGDPEQDYFADGLPGEVTTTLLR